MIAVYNRYLESHENITIKGKIRAYSFLSKLFFLDVIKSPRLYNYPSYNPYKYYIECEHLGDKNPDKVLYIVKRDESGEGFIAIIRTILYAMVFADKFHLDPVITISKRSKYFQNGGWNGILNPFEYFFKQPSGVSIKEALHSDKVVKFKPHHLEIVKDYPLTNPYYHDDDFTSFLAYYYKKYIVLNDETRLKIQHDIDSLLGNEKALGIHFRGGDYAKNYDRHPKMVYIEDYYECIDEAIDKFGYTKIFAATDDIKALEKLKDRYKEKVVSYSDVLRTDDDESVMNKESDRDNNQFLLGYEVLRDMYTLAACDSIISGISMVNIIARVAKKASGEEYIYDKYIDKGINDNLNNYDSVIYKERKNNMR